MPLVAPDLALVQEQLCDYFAGIDLGQIGDYSCLVLLERTIYPRDRKPATYAVRNIHRWPLGSKYPAVVKDLEEMLGAGVLAQARLVVDCTGVGRPVVDMLRAVPAFKDRIVAITITAGSTARFDKLSCSFHVPKIDLVGALQSAMGNNTLKVAARLDHARTLLDEMMSFKVKIDLKTGNESFEAWRSRDHDDLVLGLAVAMWFAKRARVKGMSLGPAVLTAAAPQQPGTSAAQAAAERGEEWLTV
jgi:hypothetical protein